MPAIYERTQCPLHNSKATGGQIPHGIQFEAYCFCLFVVKWVAKPFEIEKCFNYLVPIILCFLCSLNKCSMFSILFYVKVGWLSWMRPQEDPDGKCAGPTIWVQHSPYTPFPVNVVLCSQCCFLVLAPKPAVPSVGAWEVSITEHVLEIYSRRQCWF